MFVLNKIGIVCKLQYNLKVNRQFRSINKVVDLIKKCHPQRIHLVR